VVATLDVPIGTYWVHSIAGGDCVFDQFDPANPIPGRPAGGTLPPSLSTLHLNTEGHGLSAGLIGNYNSAPINELTGVLTVTTPNNQVRVVCWDNPIRINHVLVPTLTALAVTPQ
jgi:hypothetical protein